MPEVLHPQGRTLATAMDGGSAEHAAAVFGLRPDATIRLSRGKHAPLRDFLSVLAEKMMSLYTGISTIFGRSKHAPLRKI